MPASATETFTCAGCGREGYPDKACMGCGSTMYNVGTTVSDGMLDEVGRKAYSQMLDEVLYG